ncbi:Tetratricopeptide repeat protein 5 OB fold domain [Trinorchestia longiramus]|nr:Tetratricopeptide repeat protein 5 OB fold domain [Trinorchestia longiramus]
MAAVVDANLNPSSDEVLQRIKECVDCVYELRDEFVTKRGLAAAPLRDAAVEASMKETLTQLNALAQHSELQSGAVHGRVCYERGRLLSVCPGWEAQAEHHLGKASKFNIPGAWTLLGECLYNRGDLTGATTCFNRTLSTGEDKVALRNLSMLMRALPASAPQQREDNINKGVEYARRAVKQDPADGRSWMVLGNALLSAFFAVHANTTTLQACRAAYARAEQDKSACALPELHYSKFQVWWYEEQYSAALVSIRTACLLEPAWQDCRMKLQHSTSFLRSLLIMVAKHSNLSAKRMLNVTKSMKGAHLGPYERGGTPLTGDKQPDLVTFQQLQTGTNTHKIVQGIVVSTLVPESGIPFVMCLVDCEGTCLPVTVYNWAPGSEVKIGDAVAVVAPVLRIQSIDRIALNDSVELPNGEQLDLNQQEIRPSACEDYVDPPVAKNLNIEIEEKKATISKERDVKCELEKSSCGRTESNTQGEGNVKCNTSSNVECAIDESSAMSSESSPPELDVHETEHENLTSPVAVTQDGTSSEGAGAPESRKRASSGKNVSSERNKNKSYSINANNLSKTEGVAKTGNNSLKKESNSDVKRFNANVKGTSSVSTSNKNTLDKNVPENQTKGSPKKQARNERVPSQNNRITNKNIGTPGRSLNNDRSSSSRLSKSYSASSSSTGGRGASRGKTGRGKSKESTCDSPSGKVTLKNIRVVAPVMLVVNKRQVTSSQVAASYIVSQNKPE